MEHSLRFICVVPSKKQPRKKAIVVISCFASRELLTFYTFTTYIQKYLIITSGFDKHTATTIMPTVLFIFILFQPIAVIIADKIGTKTLLIIWRILSTVCTFPELWIIGNTHSIWVALFTIISLLFIMSMYTSISGV